MNFYAWPEHTVMGFPFENNFYSMLSSSRPFWVHNLYFPESATPIIANRLNINTSTTTINDIRNALSVHFPEHRVAILADVLKQASFIFHRPSDNTSNSDIPDSTLPSVNNSQMSAARSCSFAEEYIIFAC